MSGARRGRLWASAGILVALVGLVGCAQPPKSLYDWGSFPRQQYDFLLHEGRSEEHTSELQSH